ncbi:winged helix-turn-helix transcriptional regulator [Pedobacter mucosus]|uniref:winged helix-turn-helix transcriptional regulator n=1 Tax=Pedobacter mucosus TaxID=2895286 RepID=UPI001EE3B505|nr:helix-turn-helix domain-containing protein [Pedobacter mucosus]UKT65024.1 helix-turn-helix transcriptional regulator [Pedobacter mucosus]
MERKIPKEIDCGMGMIMDIIGGKWKPCLLYNIWQGHRRPSELQRLNHRASRRVLNQQLSELEEHGIITKTIYPVLPPKVEYFLTALGISLLPVIQLMDKWGSQYLNDPSQHPEVSRAGSVV